ncbi:hypothetical protein B0I72DRAFT_13774 [Yarrowia lipolytica]|uniref:YALI0E09801p n=2 Tax=Yarrowia lipolytica TaxID=4952 RepID=Q6C6G2_YARLI|nr:YALI0E09801p [Yarrowia lipolytica CLIB122]RDW26971.1 hypothetical protein B0I71DRAFT_27637 [Yarrowia lipolytica]RDW34608.1 hypothetical protein B0I72DRAFT_13774 [Yarrowia lipolytica]RDW40168.1 hypothetical protein B0I73DRAFT_28318 [Yarrowia lipolytica]RDW49343.1 hypothetical protein B0I74DRAFT_17694 [Yarrowia lipolytica]RDW55931.1 hypothetical protein B0I75DRAFT_24277 [Yarrowia lipolytica]|eukprot:XP_503750.1 YALI0E09801p [Yarrowia lipolytica CLIB122]
MIRAKFTEYKQALRNNWVGQPQYTEKDYPDIDGKNFVVTGATGGVGLEVTKLLLDKKSHVIMVGRSRSDWQPVLDQLQKDHSHGTLDFVEADLADLTTVQRAGEYIRTKYPTLDGAIFNAGVMAPPYSLTPQGQESQWGVNVVSHFLLAKYISPAVIAAAKTAPKDSVRLVWLSSSVTFVSPYEGGIKFDDINHQDDKNPSPWTLYSQSKIGDAYLAYLWSKHHPDSGVVSVSVDPGNLSSNLSRHYPILSTLKSYIQYPPKYGAYTELSALLNPAVKNNEHLIPWGVRGHLRLDVDDGRRGSVGEELWQRLNKDVAPYFKEE